MNSKIIIELRKETKASFDLCREAAEKHPEDFEAAKKYLMDLIRKRANKREGRVTQNGVIECYMHEPVKSLATMVEVLCETDFVAKSEEFRKFTHDIAVHVAALNPQYIEEANIPEDELKQMLEKWKEEVSDGKKPAETVTKIVEGKKNKYLSEVCLLNQAFFKDTTRTIQEYLDEIKGKTGENIKISRIERWQL